MILALNECMNEERLAHDKQLFRSEMHDSASQTRKIMAFLLGCFSLLYKSILLWNTHNNEKRVSFNKLFTY